MTNATIARHNVKITVSDRAGRIATTSLPAATMFELARLSVPVARPEALADVVNCSSCGMCAAVAD
jgi:hypothetical protein